MYFRRIKDIREDRDLLQKDIANKLEMTQQQYSRYEIGINEIPITLLIKLSKIYKTSTDYLLELTNEKKPYPKI